jgi:hypothetical protein
LTVSFTTFSTIASISFSTPATGGVTVGAGKEKIKLYHCTFVFNKQAERRTDSQKYARKRSLWYNRWGQERTDFRRRQSLATVCDDWGSWWLSGFVKHVIQGRKTAAVLVLAIARAANESVISINPYQSYNGEDNLLSILQQKPTFCIYCSESRGRPFPDFLHSHLHRWHLHHF